MFTKSHNHLRSILVFLISTGIFFTSCQNFINGSNLREAIQKEIDLANAQKVTCLVLAESQTGTTIPSGNTEVKIGYSFDIKFNESSSYSFVKWAAVMEKDGSDASEYVEFGDVNSFSTYATINSNVAGIMIYPICAERISVVGEPSPKWEQKGVSRDRSIIVEFTKKPAADAFIFNMKELPDNAEPVVNSANQIWAYVLDNQTYLKNISITNSDDISIAEYFSQPEVEGNILTIPVNRLNPIQLETGTTYKTIKACIKDTVPDENGIVMGKSKEWRYIITEATDETATVVLSSSMETGSVYLAGSKDYYIGQKITLSFTENADYQFLYWDFNSEFISVVEPKNISTTAIVKEKTNKDYPTEIMAVCAPRPRVTEFRPKPAIEGGSVCKDSSIKLIFSQNIPDSDEDKAQLENITISIGGSPITSSFIKPIVTGNTILFEADKTNSLQVPGNQTKTVSVYVPADFYYKTEDGTKVTYGGNGKNFEYKIDSSTNDKAKVQFEITDAESGEKIITPVGGINPAGTISLGDSAEYNIGTTAELKFTATDAYQFYGWKIVKLNGAELSDNEIVLSSVKNESVTLTAAGPCENVSVKAVVYKRPNVVSVSPVNDNAKPYAFKNEPICISFAHEIIESLKSNVAVTYSNGYISKNYYYDTSINESSDEITLTSIKMLPFANETETVTVALSKDNFYYLASDGKTKITMAEDKEWSFKIENKTMTTTTVRFAIEGNASGTKVNNELKADGATSSCNIEQELSLQYPLADDCIFSGWKIECADDSFEVSPSGFVTNGNIEVKKGDVLYFVLSVNDVDAAKATAVVKGTIGNKDGYALVVTGKDDIKPKTTQQTSYTQNGIDCDQSVIVTFNKPMDASYFDGTKDYIAVKDFPDSRYWKEFKDYFEAPTLSSNGKELKIRPKSKELETLVKANGAYDFYFYINKDVKDTDGISINDCYGEDLQIAHVVYNSGRETEKPVFTENPYMYAGLAEGHGKIVRESAYADDYWSVRISNAEFDEWGNKAVYSYVGYYYAFPARDNHCQNRFKIETLYCKDTISGVKGIRIKEILYKMPDGTDPVNPVEYTYTSPANAFVESTYTPGNYSLKEPLVYTFQTEQDGVLKIDIQVEDNAGNLSEEVKTYYLIKDTTLNINGNYLNISVTQPKDYETASSVNRTFTLNGLGEKYAANDNYSYGPSSLDSWPNSDYIPGYYSFYLEYGEVENNLVKTDVKYVNSNKNKTITIPVNPDKDTIVDLYVLDSVGNKASFRNKLPRRIKLFDTKYDENWNEMRFYSESIDPGFETEDIECQPWYYFYYTYTKNIETTTGVVNLNNRLKLTTSFNHCDDPTDYLESSTLNSLGDTYRIYVQPAYLYLYKNYPSKSFTMYGTPSLIYDSKVTAGTLPQTPEFSITGVEKGVANSGLCKAVLTLTNKEDGVDYYFNSPAGYSKLELSAENKAEVELVSGKEDGAYNVVAVNSEGNTKGTAVVINTKTLALDTLPPKIEYTNNVLRTEEFRYTEFTYSYDGSYFMVKDITDAIGFSDEETAGGYYSVDCYYGQNMQSDYSLEILDKTFLETHKTWSFNKLKAIKVDESAGSYKNVFGRNDDNDYIVAIPLCDIEDEEPYMLWLGKNDKAGNYSSGLKVNGAAIYTLKQRPEITLSGTTLKASVTPEVSESHTYSNYSATIYKWDESKKNWNGVAATKYKIENIGTSSSYVYMRQPDDNATDSLMVDDKTKKSFMIEDVGSYTGTFGAQDIKGKFIKTVVRADVDYTTNKEEYMKDLAAFSYPSYVYVPDGSKYQDNICAVKNLFTSRNYVTVMSDKPCLVQVVASNKNHGGDLKNVDEWERRGYKSNTQMITLSATENMKNYSVDTSEVESGDYYVIIAHFADGTSAISDVFQK